MSLKDALNQECTTQILWQDKNFFFETPRANTLFYMYIKIKLQVQTFWAGNKEASTGHI